MADARDERQIGTMTITFDPGTPYKGAELVAAMDALTERAAVYLTAMSPEEFARPQGDRWSPADHLRHLSKSGFAIARGLKVPRLMLRLTFGAPPKSSRTFPTLRNDYRAVLAAGGQAGSFAPEARPLPPDLVKYQADVIATWQQANGDMVRAMRRWDEATLDRYAIKHPLLGKLTVREMLMFAHYHESHHLNLLASRRA